MSSQSTSLLVLPLSSPHILFPGTQLKVAVDEYVGQQLVSLIRDAKGDNHNTKPVHVEVAAIPVLEKSTTGSNKKTDSDSELGLEMELYGWGCAAKIIRIQIARSSSATIATGGKYLVTLEGQSRVRIVDSHSTKGLNTSDQNALRTCFVEYPPRGRNIPHREVVTEFKSAALKLLDHLAEGGINASGNASNDIEKQISIISSSRSHQRSSLARFATMVEEISDSQTPWLADLMVWSIIADYSDKLEFLSLYDPDTRLKRATELFVKYASISEVTQKIARSVDESLHKQQKELFLRQQLAAIQRELAKLNSSRHSLDSDSISGARSGLGAGSRTSELDAEEGSDEEEMSDVRRRIEAMEPESEERRMAVREWRRMKRIPAQSVEYGVLRTYLEWLTSIPWPSSSNASGNIVNTKNNDSIIDIGNVDTNNDQFKDRSFLTLAREQLDKDHYGLDKIKQRLIEYLAVIRLRQLSEEAKAIGEASSDEARGMLKEISVGASDAKSTEKMGKELQLVNKTTTGIQPALKGRTTRRKGAGIKGPILLFVGPPGTGKTSLGQSIARALGRPFQRISLGGVRDEAEIRGHRRTYVASGPGLFVQALRKAGRLDPVILLDEIDKVGQINYHGDVSSALLEVLDPEQNHSFTDHYLSVPIDLSKVVFICTANSLDTISPPLLDRCEVITLSGYTFKEKEFIAKRWLVPKQVEANAMEEGGVELDEGVLKELVGGGKGRGWGKGEAGVRGLERIIGELVRWKAVRWAEAVESGRKEVYDPKVRIEDLEMILGPSRGGENEEESEGGRDPKKGLVYGLVVMGGGNGGGGEGGIMPVETAVVPGGEGRLKLTGSLGEVIKESGEIALSWVKTNAYGLGITKEELGVKGMGTDEIESGKGEDLGMEWMKKDPLKVLGVDIHLHLPAGAQKKDGPSAGVAMVCAFVSLLTGAVVPTNVAMTGEITLRGRVTPVGGIKEKVLGAHRAHITKVILPYSNRKDVEYDVPSEVRDSIQFVFVRTVEEALEAAFGEGVLAAAARDRSRRNINAGMRVRVGKNGEEFVESRL